MASKNISMLELANINMNLTNSNSNTVHADIEDPQENFRPNYDYLKTSQELGFIAETEIEEGLKEIYRVVKQMNIGVISDAATTSFYLKSLQDINNKNLDAIYCLGDLVGYYDRPNDVIDLLRENQIICLKGNHDKYFINELSFDEDKRCVFINWQTKTTSFSDNTDYLKNLPDCLDVEILDKRFLTPLNAIQDTETYLNDANQLDREFLKDFDYYLYGHLARCNVQYRYGTCLLNPGSVGQPRDYNASPSYAVDLSRDNFYTRVSS